MKTIAGKINWDFKANGDLEIKDKNGKKIYWENSDEVWSKMEYNSKGNCIYYENSRGFWAKLEYDSQGNCIYSEYSNGLWAKKEYDSKGNQIYYEDSDGKIIDNRPKPCENKIVEIEGIKYKLVKQ